MIGLEHTKIAEVVASEISKKELNGFNEIKAENSLGKDICDSFWSQLFNSKIDSNKISENIEKIGAELYYSNIEVIDNRKKYMDDNGKKINENEHKAISRHEIKLSLSELISNAKRLLKPIGLLYFIHRTHRLVEIIKTLDKNNFSVKKIIFIYSAQNNKSTMMFVEAIKGKKVKLEIENYYI